jgi:hypothetical protein
MIQVQQYLLTESDYDNVWGQIYQALNTCKDLQTRYGSANPYYSGMADVLAAMNWGILTDMWGDIPFSDALQGSANNYQSKYDPQEQVITGIVTLLDGAIQKLQQPDGDNELLPGSDDLVFLGDPAAWVKVAYTLKARYLNRLSNKSSYNPVAILDALSNGISTPAEDFITVHGDNTAANQWYDFQNNRPGYIVASAIFVDSISLRPTDQRLYAYFVANDSGVVTGSQLDVPDVDASPYGTYLAGSAATGVRLISYAEAKFIEAEVKARQNAADAADVLNEAIMASCSTVTNGAYDGADIAVYTPATTDLSRVMFEKWIALFGTPEGYNDYRKTGFPVLTVNPAGHLAVIPKRCPTPQAERTGNPNAPTPELTDPVWFAQ